MATETSSNCASPSCPEYRYETHPCVTNGLKPRRGSQIHRELSAVYRPAYDAWLRSFGLKPCWETHKDCLELFVWHGYRPNPSPISYCLKSAFYPSNETLNVWTHFVPFLFLTWRSFAVLSALKDPYEEITYPFWTQAFGTSAVFLASSFAHLFNCYSAIGQEVCYCLDYGMIPVFGLAATISYHHYLCSFKCFGFNSDAGSSIYLIAMFFISSLASLLTTYSRYPFCRMKYICRFGPYAICVLLGGFPCILRYYSSEEFKKSLPVDCLLGGEKYETALQVIAVIFVVAIGFVASRFPERWFAGRFDIVGQSHQWFHIFTAIGIYIQHCMAETALKEAIDLRDRKLLDEKALGISFWSTFAPLLVFLSLLPFLILRTAYQVGRIIEADRCKVS